MDMDFSYAMFGSTYFTGKVVALVVSLICYIFCSIGLYTIAKRRGIHNPWLAWIPVVNVWIVGSISDQYRYVTKGQIRNKRIVLLVMLIILRVSLFAMRAALRGTVMSNISMVMGGMPDEAWMEMVRTLLGFLAVASVLLVFAIVAAVFHFMAMYDLYVSVNPEYSVAMLVLSIIFNFTEAFFVFFNRKKDLGMPPRCDIPMAPVQPVPSQPLQLPVQEPVQEPAEENPEE